MEHVFTDVCMELEYTADPRKFNSKLTGPMFIGQGCTQHIGSDYYGNYIVDKKQIGKKTIWGLHNAKAHFATDWTDGSMICEGPRSWNALTWIVARGKTW